MIGSRISSVNSQQILQKLFITPSQKEIQQKRQELKLNLKLLKEIAQQQNYRTAIQLILILQKVLLTGNKRLSLRQLLLNNSNKFIRSNSNKFTFKQFPNLQKQKSGKDSNHQLIMQKTKSLKEQMESPKKQAKNIENIENMGEENKQEEHQLFISEELSKKEKLILVECLSKIKPNFEHTIYENKINLIINLINQKSDKKLQSSKNIDQDITKKILKENQLILDGKSNIDQFITKGYLNLDSKFSSFQSLYTFLSVEILPLIQRRIMSIPIINHLERQSFLIKTINFIQGTFLHQFLLQIKINRATLIQNRIFIQKIWKQNLKKYQKLILNNSMATILNQALLCPSVMEIQLPLFRILKRMYFLWINNNSNNYFDLKNQQINRIGQLIKFPLFINIKNISLYSSNFNQDQHLKQSAMFCYKIVNQKNDLQLVNLIQNQDQLRFIRQSKYYSSKAYAFSEQIYRIYDTFDLKLNNFWHYQKRINKSEIWNYNILVQKPNSLLIWQFWLNGYDIKFGIYKVQSFKKQTIEQYLKQIECKQILKLQKSSSTITQTQKGFIFLKNGMYRLLFDNSYSTFRAKDLSYLIMHLQSQN